MSINASGMSPMSIPPAGSEDLPWELPVETPAGSAPAPATCDGTSNGRFSVLAGLAQSAEPSSTLPKPQQLRIGDAQQDLQRLSDMITSLREADGSLDLSKLKEQISRDGTPRSQHKAFWDILETHQRTNASGPINPSCLSTSHTPKRLTDVEVGEVLNDLAKARAKLAGLDHDGDGAISYEEANSPTVNMGLDDRLVDDATQSFQDDFERWATTVQSARDSIVERQKTDQLIATEARRHAATDEGAEAIIAMFRRELAGDTVPLMVKERIAAAEDSFFSHFLGGLFGKKNATGNLSDAEVREMVGAHDLAAFTRESYRAIEAHLGGSYEASFLTGSDLVGADQVDDPDAKSFTPRC